MQHLSSIYRSSFIGRLPSPSPEAPEDVNVLIAEDTRAHRIIIEEALEGSGLTLQFVNDGRAAIKYLEQYDPDICLIDWNMPYYDGGQVIKQVREGNNTKGRKSPIFIVLTTSDTEKNRQAAYAAGANAYIVKPLELDDLSEALDNTRKFWFQPGIRLPKRSDHE